MPLTKITGEEFDNTQGGLIVAGIITASSNLLVSGNLGIGTLTPQEKFHISNSASSNYIRLDNPSGRAYYGLNSSGDTEIIAATNNNLIFKTFGTERARIDSSARLGIGTNNPQRQLHIYGNNCELLIEDPLNSVNSNRLNIYLSGDKAQFRMLNQTGTGGTTFLQGDAIGNITLPTANTSILNSSGRKILNQTGGILQVIHTEYTTATALGCAALTDVSGFSAAITPSSTSSKVLVIVHFSGLLDCDGQLSIKVGGSVVKANLSGTDRFSSTVPFNYYDAGTYCATYLHSPASTSALTYQIAVQCGGCGQTAYFNRDPSNSANNGRSGITLMEVSG
jgi:hypothetical protein